MSHGFLGRRKRINSSARQAGSRSYPPAIPPKTADFSSPGELERWSALLASDNRTDALWLDARKSGQPVLAQAEEELMFDRQGRTAGAFYGSTPQIHEEAEAALAKLMR